MKIIKDERKWRVRAVLPNRDCPYLIYPANYHGCRWGNSIDVPECNMEKCPIREKPIPREFVERWRQKLGYETDTGFEPADIDDFRTMLHELGLKIEGEE